MNEDLTRWSFDDFLCYLLIYAASADFILKDEEKQIIIKKMGEEKFNKFFEIFEGHSDMDKIDTVMTLKGSFIETEDDKEKVLNQMKEVFQADHAYSESEHELLIAIRKLL